MGKVEIPKDDDFLEADLYLVNHHGEALANGYAMPAMKAIYKIVEFARISRGWVKFVPVSFELSSDQFQRAMKELDGMEKPPAVVTALKAPPGFWNPAELVPEINQAWPVLDQLEARLRGAAANSPMDPDPPRLIRKHREMVQSLEKVIADCDQSSHTVDARFAELLRQIIGLVRG